MANFTFELVLGDDQETYDNLRAALPPGENNLARGILVPAHPQNQPQTFAIGGLTAGVSYVVDFTGEWQTPPTPRMYFVPIGESYNITVALPYGPVTVTVRDAGLGEYRTFLLSVVNYATLFRAYAREITEYSKVPLNQVEESIASPLSFRLVTPMLGGLTNLIPSDLEILASLAHKLLVKNLLHEPGTLGATTEILAAFSASNPIFFKMKNIDKFDSPMFRSEEVFQGYEAHVWLPNKEVERWKAFIQLLNNLPQLYTLRQITEGEVYVEQGGKLRRHLFDFDSPLANSITTGLSYLTDCFLRLFTLNVSVESEHFLAFCQATYILDQLILNALSPTDADPLDIEPWTKFSLSGRFGQQFGITNIHEWIYDTPLRGVVDGVNRYFRLTKFPKSTSAVKVFVDGLLKRLYQDYRVSLSGNIISSAYRILSMPLGPLLVYVELGEPRPFLGPIFSSFEVRGGAQLQMLLTGVEQGLDNVSFIISHPPATNPVDPQAVAIHFVTPSLPNTGNPGENQYGQISLTAGISSYPLTFTQPAVSIDYQLLISITVDPMPSGDPTLVQQVVHIVREHTLTGATIEFSAPLAADMKLNWWVVEDDSLTLERGTLLLTDGIASIPLAFTGGPYFDQVILILQLWETNPIFIDAAQYLVSSMTVGPGGTTVRFSAPIVGSNYRLDYALFPARGGDFIEFFEPPLGLIEAHYDVKWEHWINAALSPAPDGIRTRFSLPYPVSDPKSIYLALDGRLMTQGADKQYTVADDTVIFTFPPTFNQKPWSVYPVSTIADELTSTWDQSFLNYMPTADGEYATGWIKAENAIAVGDTLSLDGLAFEATDVATGVITNGNLISVGSSVRWAILGVTLVGVPDATIAMGTITNSSIISTGSTVTWGTLTVTLTGVTTAPTTENEFTVGVSQLLDAAALITAINLHSILSLSYLASSGGTGIVIVQSKDADITFEILSVTGSLTATNIEPNENYFTVGISKDDDTASLIAAINAHSILSLRYIALPVGSGFTVIKAKEFDGGFYNDILIATVSLSVSSNIVGDSSPCSYNSYTIYLGEHVVSISSAAVDVVADTFYHLDHPYYEGLGVASIPRILLSTNTIISLGSTVTWGTLGVTLTGVTTPSTENEFLVGISKDADARSLLAAILAHSVLSHHYIAWYGGTSPFGSLLAGGIVAIQAKIINSEVITTSGSLTATSIATGTLPAPLATSTIYYVVNPTTDTFQLSLTPYGTPIDLTTTGTGYHTFISQDIEIATSMFAFPTKSISLIGNVILNSPVITNIIPPNTEMLVGMGVTGTNIPANAIIKTVDSLNQITLNINATGTTALTPLTMQSVFRDNEPVRFSTDGSLPSGLNEGQRYYAINITQNRFQVSDVIGGTPVAFTDGGVGALDISSIPRFAAGINQSHDLLALATEILKHPITGAKVTVELTDGTITATAKEVGVRYNFPLEVSGTSMTSHGLLAGQDPSSTVYATSKICYYYDAPVTTLDGLSTRLWKQYEGDKFVFTYPPTLQQESYYISEVYPIEYHPLDSTVANLPCNYPKGLFTQGFGTHFNETDIAVDQPGTLVISTANLPVQEQPDGMINGINTSFTITFESCAGQDSMMLWIDGIFQPPNKYVYTDMGSYGQITLFTPPAIGQELWVWYLPLGTACINERVDALTVTLNPQIFDVPDTWTDTPTLVAYLEGLFVLQGQDYSVINSNTQIQFGTITPSGQSLWAHYNLGLIPPVDKWRQIYVGTTDGLLDTFMTPHLLLSELPTSVDSVLVFLDGLNQGGKYVVEVDGFGNPTGNIIFTGGAPEANRRLDVVYIRN